MNATPSARSVSRSIGGRVRHGSAGEFWRLLLGVGVLGGFTTFSAFSLDAALLWQRGETTGAALYVAVSVAAAIIGVFAGLAVMRAALS